MVAVILAGGTGARLKPLTITVPKPLLPLGDVPILEIVIRQLAAAGIDRLVLTLGPMAPVFSALIGDGSKWGVDIDYCVEGEPLGTAGPLRLAKNLGENFLVMNGDLLTTLDYRELCADHRQHDAMGTIAVTQRQVPIDYGVVEASEQGLLTEYREKPQLKYEVSMGINVLSRKCLPFIPPSQKFDMPDLLTAMQRAGKRVRCYKTRCYWQDIGRIEDYERANADFVSDPSQFLPDLGRKQCARV